jgi:hypothetical protein
MGVSLRGLALLLAAAALVGCTSNSSTPKQADGSAEKSDKQGPKDTPPEKQEPPKEKAAEPANTRDVFLVLPRFAQGADRDDIEKALASIPAAKVQYTRTDNLQYGKPGYFGIMVRYDTAKVDVGDIAKALTALGGDKSRAVAVLSLSLLTEISEADVAALKKELATAKGIDWKLSGPYGIALGEAGEAKYAEILAGYKKAGILLHALADQ